VEVAVEVTVEIVTIVAVVVVVVVVVLNSLSPDKSSVSSALHPLAIDVMAPAATFSLLARMIDLI